MATETRSQIDQGITLPFSWFADPAVFALIIFRLVQGVGAACLIANSTAILTDAFPPEQRGVALGINMVAGLGGSLVGLLLGGVLAAISWRWGIWRSDSIATIRPSSILSVSARCR